MYQPRHMSITLRDAAPQEICFNTENNCSPDPGTDLGDLETSAEGYFSRENLLRKTDHRRSSPVEHLPVSMHHRTPEHGRCPIDSANLFTYPPGQSPKHFSGFTPTPPRRQSSLPFSLTDDDSADTDLAGTVFQDVCYFEDSIKPEDRYLKNSCYQKSVPHTITSADDIDDSGISTSMTSKSMDQELQEAAAAAEASAVAGRKLDDSLTNIQWLEGMKGNNLNSGGTSIHRDLRLLTSQRQIDKISRECGRTKRPPFSYMHLIQMAICSSPDGRKTLKEIYQWIQDQFPYYKHHLNQGWKNSIRHNLSLYDIFVREKNKQPGQTGCSYWTIRPDAECKPLRSKHTAAMLSKEELPDDNCEVPPVFVVSGYESPGNLPTSEHKSKKAGPVPLLPKPPPVQAYALIPIQGGVPMLSQPLLVHSVTQAAQVAQQALIGESSASPIPWASPEDLMDSKPKAVKRNIAPTPTTEAPRRKQPKILAKPNILNRAIRIKNEPNDSLSTDSGLDLSCSLSIDRPQTRQLTASSSLCGDPLAPMCNSSIMSTFTPQGLPKPKMYNKRKCKLIPKVHREDGMDETSTAVKCIELPDQILVGDQGSLSESGVQDLLASVSHDLSSPLRSLLQTPPKGNLKKGEMFCHSVSSTPDYILVSPIQGSGSESSRRSLEKAGGFLFTPDSEGRCSRNLAEAQSEERTTDPFTFTHLKSSTPYHSEASPKLKMSTPFKFGSPSLCFKSSSETRSPGLGSLQGLGLTGLTPLKSPQRANAESPEGCMSNQSFTRLFGEFHLDSMLEDSINIDVAELNFSDLQ